MAPHWAFLLAALSADAGPTPVSIRAPHAELQSKREWGRYWGGVTVTRGALTMTCEQLEIFFTGGETERLVASGHVHAVERDREAWGETATYLEAQQRLEVTGSPRLRSDGREVVGERLTLFTDSDRLELERPVGVATQTDSSEVTISADHLVLDSQRRAASWEGHVRAVKHSTLASPKRPADTVLLAPTLIAHYDASGSVTRIIGTGGVEATQGDRWAKGKRGDYDVTSGSLVVTGQPQARDGRTQLKGSRVTFDSIKEHLEVEDAETIVEVDGKKVR